MNFTGTLKNKTTKIIRYSTPISTFNNLSKCHDPHIILSFQDIDDCGYFDKFERMLGCGAQFPSAYGTQPIYN